MLPRRRVGKTEIESSIPILGGQIFSVLPRKSMPDDEEAVNILKYLYENDEIRSRGIDVICVDRVPPDFSFDNYRYYSEIQK